MEQPKSQDLENRVGVLEGLKAAASRSSVKNVFEAAAFGAGSAAFLYIGSIAPPASDTVGIIVRGSNFVTGGVAGIISLIIGAMSISDYHRSNLLGDEIARIKQSPDYKAHEGPVQNS